MFREASPGKLQANQNQSINQGLMNQQMHPFQAHLPPSNYNGQALPPYQSIKKAVPMMHQDNRIELVDKNNTFDGLSKFGMNGQIPPQPDGVAYPPNQPIPQQYQQTQQLAHPEVDPYDVVVPPGGLLYFNQLATLSTQRVPSSIKLERQSCTCLLILNLVLLIATIGAFVMLKIVELQIWMLGPMIGAPYFIYLVVGLMVNNAMPTFFNNLIDAAQIEKSFETVKHSKGDMTFLANCYHKAIGRHFRKVTTHTAKSSFPLSNCVDESQDFSTIKQQNAFLVATASTCFYFGDQQSQTKFLNAFKVFRDANRKDKSQTFTHAVSIMTPNMGQPFAICTSGSGCYVKPLYYLLFLLGLGYPYTIFIECRIGRYRLNSVKKLTAA